MIELFIPEDYQDLDRVRDPSIRRRAADASNAKLNAYIQCLDKFYGDIKLGSYHGAPLLWSVDEKPDSTHSVRLIGVERLIKTPGPG